MASVETFRDNFEVRDARAVLLRNKILRDLAALRKWIDMIPLFAQSPIDQLKLSNLLHDRNYARGVLGCFQIWHETTPEQARYDDFIKILERPANQLNDLAGTLRNPAIRKQIFNADQPEELVVQDERFRVENFRITYRSLSTIRDIICAGIITVERWSEIKDTLILRRLDVTANLGIDESLDAGRRSEAILTTLENWISVEAHKANFHKLLGILAEYDLQALIRTLIDAPVVRELRRLENLNPDPLVEPPAAPQAQGANQQDQEQVVNAQQLQEGRLCPACQDEYYDHVSQCGHFLCGNCVGRIRPNNIGEYLCPSCGVPVSPNRFRRVYFPY